MLYDEDTQEAANKNRRISPMNGKERYNIYSASKAITCVAALLLWEKGLFSLDDKLSDYMSEFENMTVKTEGGVVPAKNPILIRHLFEMSAGFDYNVDSPSIRECREKTGGRCPTREMMKYLAKEPLLFEPGAQWKYSLCHDVLAAFVEVVSGEKFEIFVKKNIFDVLGMNDSTFMLPEDELDTISGQYIFRNNITERINNHIQGYKLGTEFASGGAGCISTVDDYVKFLEALRTHKLLRPETLEFMITDRLTDSQRATYTKPEYGFGLGVRCYKEGGEFKDFGWGGAAGVYFSVDVENELTLFFGCHLLASPVQGLRAMIYRIIIAELLGNDDFDSIENELKQIHNYNFTY